ncbi:MAG: sugar phosphate nucleotidyltransferase [Candidatus Daviesbacteria bacterium]|nr:sugar phosphate nucleotidyltransferase [Candidatus Daviesbacteria bacterium]
MNNLCAVILAGGKGTRMESELPKVLHEIKGVPMIYYSIEKLLSLGIEKIVVVVGFKAEDVKKKVQEKFQPEFAYQDTPLGTGHALSCALKDINEEGDILVVNGDDSAFYRNQTLSNFIKSHLQSQAVATMMTLKMAEENSLGKIIVDSNSKFIRTIEAKEAKEQGLNSDLVNCGAYLFNISWVKKNISKIPQSVKGEYYITELFNIAATQGDNVNLYSITDQKEWVGVNTQDELSLANRLMNAQSA